MGGRYGGQYKGRSGEPTGNEESVPHFEQAKTESLDEQANNTASNVGVLLDASGRWPIYALVWGLWYDTSLCVGYPKNMFENSACKRSGPILAGFGILSCRFQNNNQRFFGLSVLSLDKDYT